MEGFVLYWSLFQTAALLPTKGSFAPYGKIAQLHAISLQNVSMSSRLTARYVVSMTRRGSSLCTVARLIRVSAHAVVERLSGSAMPFRDDRAGSTLYGCGSVCLLRKHLAGARDMAFVRKTIARWPHHGTMDVVDNVRRERERQSAVQVQTGEVRALDVQDHPR